MSDLVLPNAIDAEMALIGCLFIAPECLPEVLAHVSAGDFYDQRHERIVREICWLDEQRLPIDRVAVVERLRATGVLQRFGGPAYLSTFSNGIPDAASVAYYAKLVGEKALLRRLIATGSQISDLARSGEVDPRKAVSDALGALQFVSEGKDSSKHLSPRQRASEAYFRAIDETRPPRVSTPWAGLNNLLGGCYPAQLWLWAGAPKAGKSAAILCLADYIAQTFGQVVYFAIEMDEPEVTQRQLAMYSGVQVIRQNSGDLSNFEKAKLKKASDDISKYPLQIVRHSVRSIVDMRRFLRRQLSGGPIKSVIVDHVGKMTDVLSGSAKENKVERLDKTYNLLIDIAREFECTVHAIQHINRAGQQQGNRPTLIDIRDGGNPEGHANAVIFVHRPDPMNLEGNGHEGEFIVAASRNGKAGIINVKFDAWRGVWSEPEERSELTCGSR